jgi:SpoVK/Ycf46/Vps4 family AAA+-type ATPase
MANRSPNTKEMLIDAFKSNPDVNVTVEKLMVKTGSSRLTVQAAMRELLNEGELDLQVSIPGREWWLDTGKTDADAPNYDAVVAEALDTEDEARSAAKEVLKKVFTAFGKVLLEPHDVMMVIGTYGDGKTILQDAEGKLYKARRM